MVEVAVDTTGSIGGGDMGEGVTEHSGRRPEEWTVEEVGQWVAASSSSVLAQYSNCFTDNFIDGRKLRHINASSLPRIGICKFEHVREASAAIRKLYGLPAPNALASVADVPFSRCWYAAETEEQGPGVV